MNTATVICDHGRLASGNDSAHVYSVLTGLGYGVRYVSRSYEGDEDVLQIATHKPAVIVADPSVRVNGSRRIDQPFRGGLESICKATGAVLVLFALKPSELGVEGILDKEDHPSIVKRVGEAHLEYVRATRS